MKNVNQTIENIEFKKMLAVLKRIQAESYKSQPGKLSAILYMALSNVKTKVQHETYKKYFYTWQKTTEPSVKQACLENLIFDFIEVA